MFFKFFEIPHGKILWTLIKCTSFDGHNQNELIPVPDIEFWSSILLIFCDPKAQQNSINVASLCVQQVKVEHGLLRGASLWEDDAKPGAKQVGGIKLSP